MRIHKRRLAWIAGLTLLAVCAICAMQFAFWNVGQEFGAYGQYHRVLRVVRSMNDYTIVHHGVRRKLEVGSLAQVEEFSLRLRDRTGQVGTVLFRKDTPEMTQKDEGVLRTMVREKFQAAVATSRR